MKRLRAIIEVLTQEWFWVGLTGVGLAAIWTWDVGEPLTWFTSLLKTFLSGILLVAVAGFSAPGRRRRTIVQAAPASAPRSSRLQWMARMRRLGKLARMSPARRRRLRQRRRARSRRTRAGPQWMKPVISRRGSVPPPPEY